MSSLYLRGMAPSLKAASSNAKKPLKPSGASSPIFLSLARFFMSYIAASMSQNLFVVRHQDNRPSPEQDTLGGRKFSGNCFVGLSCVSLSQDLVFFAPVISSFSK